MIARPSLRLRFMAPIAGDLNWYTTSAAATMNELRQDRGAYRLTVVQSTFEEVLQLQSLAGRGRFPN